jgi:hypothetical protein
MKETGFEKRIQNILRVMVKVYRGMRNMNRYMCLQISLSLGGPYSHRISGDGEIHILATPNMPIYMCRRRVSLSVGRPRSHGSIGERDI